MNRPNFVIKPIPTLRPQAPPVRIDTCIVGDETTCEMDKHEVCLTYLGVSTCDCKPGYGRKDYRKACRSEFSFLFFPPIFLNLKFFVKSKSDKKFREIKILLKNFVKLIGFLKLFQKLYD